MSRARGIGQNGLKLYSNITMPAKIDMTFQVTPASINGLGISSLKSNGYVQNVFMHTSATPGSNAGVLNPNPANGYAMIQLKQNFNKYLGFLASVAAPVTGSALTSVTAASVYVIGSVGTTTLAQWKATGLPAGLVPTIGQTFIATATGALGGTGTVFVPGVSGIGNVEMIGDPNTEVGNGAIATNAGALLFVQFLAPTSSSITTPIPVAPATNSIISLSAYYDMSSVTIDGL